MFNIGRHAVNLSDSLSKIDIENKNIYFVPLNYVTEVIANEFIKQSPKSINFIDNFKTGKNIIKPSSIKEYDYIFLYSPNYQNEILKQLPKKNLYILHNKRKNGYLALPLNSLFLLKETIQEKVINFYLNLLYKTRLTSLNKFNITLHSNEIKLKKLKSIHKNQRAFIIGNGPSLTIDDLNKLKGDITFASNKIFLAYDETTWRPTYYSVEDSLDINEYYNEIKNLSDSIKLLPFKHIKEHDIIKDAIYYPLIPNKEENLFECSNNLLTGIYPGASVTYSMLQIALFMGIKEIYLIGVDFNYSIPNEYNDKITIYHQQENNHFHKDYRKKGDLWGEPSVEKQKQSFLSAKKFADKNNIKIYNASRVSKLDIFDKINLDSLF